MRPPSAAACTPVVHCNGIAPCLLHLFAHQTVPVRLTALLLSMHPQRCYAKHVLEYPLLKLPLPGRQLTLHLGDPTSPELPSLRFEVQPCNGFSFRS
jgi:hypothetical protein